LRRFSQIESQRSEEWCVEDTPYKKPENLATKNSKSHEKEEKELSSTEFSVASVISVARIFWPGRKMQSAE
jgi:hypothetical protein